MSVGLGPKSVEIITKSVEFCSSLTDPHPLRSVPPRAFHRTSGRTIAPCGIVIAGFVAEPSQELLTRTQRSDPRPSASLYVVALAVSPHANLGAVGRMAPEQPTTAEDTMLSGNRPKAESSPLFGVSRAGTWRDPHQTHISLKVAQEPQPQPMSANR